ncbi:hypothetical protein HOD29_00840 [archaeon]|jgi:stage II sporulation protein M|nr:hypothetical protein [archaeon]
MKNNFLKGEYRSCFKFIRESQRYIYFSIILFIVFALIGFFVRVPEEFSVAIVDYFKQLIEQTSGFNSLEMMGFIFSNNLQASFFGMIFGVFFGIFPLINTISNGFILGFASNLAVFENGFFSLWRLLPHGIFELPAIFISLGLGLKIGSFVWEKNKWKILKKYFEESVRVFVFIILPLLIIAAIIEGLLVVLI